VAKRLAEKGLIIEVTDAAKNFLLKKGYEPKFGARPLRRTIQRYIEDKLADILLEGKIKPGEVIKVDVADDDIAFTPIQDEGPIKASGQGVAQA